MHGVGYINYKQHKEYPMYKENFSRKHPPKNNNEERNPANTVFLWAHVTPFPIPVT